MDSYHIVIYLTMVIYQRVVLLWNNTLTEETYLCHYLDLMVEISTPKT